MVNGENMRQFGIHGVVIVNGRIGDRPLRNLLIPDCSLLLFFLCSCYTYIMTIEQTIDIPADHRLILDIPKEFPAGTAQMIIKFPVKEDDDTSWFEKGEGCPICAKHRDPKTGEPLYNAETIAAIEEGDAMLRGEIPAQRFNSIEELLADLRS